MRDHLSFKIAKVCRMGQSYIAGFTVLQYVAYGCVLHYVGYCRGIKVGGGCTSMLTGPYHVHNSPDLTQLTNNINCDIQVISPVSAFPT